MALQHTPANEVIHLQQDVSGTTGKTATLDTSHAIAKGEHLEIIRIVLRPGDTRPRHAVDAEMTIQCLAGSLRLRLSPGGRGAENDATLAPGDLLLLAAGTGYDLRAECDAVALLTIALPYAGSASMSSPGYR